MNLYRISRTVHHYYESYDSAVVVAESEEEARQVDPLVIDPRNTNWKVVWGKWGTWVDSPKDVRVEYLGKLDNEQIEGRVICCSLNTL